MGSRIITSLSNGGPSPLGQILIHRGQARAFQIDFILELQRAYQKNKIHKKLGELLLEHRVVNPLTLREALDTQNLLPQESVSQIVERLEAASGLAEVTDVSRVTKLIKD